MLNQQGVVASGQVDQLQKRLQDDAQKLEHATENVAHLAEEIKKKERVIGELKAVALRETSELEADVQAKMELVHRLQDRLHSSESQVFFLLVGLLIVDWLLVVCWDL